VRRLGSLRAASPALADSPVGGATGRGHLVVKSSRGTFLRCTLKPRRRAGQLHRWSRGHLFHWFAAEGVFARVRHLGSLRAASPALADSPVGVSFF